MRRAIPWALLTTVVLGIAAGAALGATERTSASTQPPAQWVAGVLATTERAGSARFAYTHVTQSSNPDLRAELRGSGVVDFVRGDVRVSEVDHDISISSAGNRPVHPVPTTSTVNAIVVGGVVYQSNPIPGLAFSDRYVRLPFPAVPRAQRGLALALNASVPLSALRGPEPVAAVRDLGPGVVDGTATTRYEVAYTPRSPCAPAHGTPATVTQPPSTVWVDGRGRLVQVRSTARFNGRLPRGATLLPAFRALLQGPTTTIATLTFSDFGAPVHVTAPPTGNLVVGARSKTSYSTFQVGSRCHS